MLHWIKQLDETTASFKTQFGNLTAQELNWKPNANTWSIAQNIDHLIVINRTYFPILDALQTGKYAPPFLAKIGFISNFLGNMIYDSVKPENKKKIRTFSIWEPATSQIKGDILTQFEQHQIELKNAIIAAVPFIEKGQVIHSPANKNIVYKLDKAFDVIVAHEIRHLEQAKEVQVLLKKHKGTHT